MKIKVQSSSLVEALKRAKLAAFRASLPSLGCALIEAENGKLRVTGTNLEQRISSSIEAEVETAGNCLLNCERLLAIVGRISGDVSITVKGTDATITGGGISAKLHGLPIEDFPAQGGEEEVKSQFICESFADHLSRVSFAMSDDKSRYVLNGVHLRESGGVVILEASDGRTLHLMDTGAECKAIDAILPSSAVGQIESIFPSMTVSVSITERNAIVSTPEITLTTKLVEATFPNVAVMIPEDIKVNMVAKSEDLISALDTVASGRQNLNQCRISSTKAGIEFSAEIEGGGKVRKLIEAPQKEESKTCCNWNLMREAIKSARCEEAQMMIRELDPIVIRNGGFTGIFMPMRPRA